MASGTWIDGLWHGEYRYGDGYAEPRPEPVPFRLSLSAGRFGRFAGYVRDDATAGGMPERGRIRGRIRGDELFFRKVMPAFYALDENGELLAADELAKRLDVPRDVLPTEHVIEYRGRREGDTMRGTWRIPGLIEDGDDNGSGTWSAVRQSELVDEI